MSAREDTIAALTESLTNAVVNDISYGGYIRDVSRLQENFVSVESKRTPMIFIVDGGTERTVSEDGDSIMRETDIGFWILVSDQTKTNLLPMLNDATESLQKFLYSAPALSANGRAIRFESIERLAHEASDKIMAISHTTAKLIYAIPKSEIPGWIAPGTDDYGDQWMIEGRDLIVARLDALQAEMTGLNPGIAAVYDHHNEAGMLLNAVSVDIAPVISKTLSAADRYDEYSVTYTLRIHTGYIGGAINSDSTYRLMTSVINKLNAKSKLADNYTLEGVTNVSPVTEFTESHTTGAQADIEVTINVQHTQES